MSSQDTVSGRAPPPIWSGTSSSLRLVLATLLFLPVLSLSYTIVLCFHQSQLRRNSSFSSIDTPFSCSPAANSNVPMMIGLTNCGIVVEYNLRLPSMLHGKKGFERLVWAAKTVLNNSLQWLFFDLNDDHAADLKGTTHIPGDLNLALATGPKSFVWASARVPCSPSLYIRCQYSASSD